MTIEFAPTIANEDYRVDLAVFQGPLDLLLYLIKKEEVDIYDIPIAKITKQYLRYIEMMTDLNLEIAGEFILMAATLIRIKTRLLLPRNEEDPDEADPREELIMALIEYKKYKEAGEVLREKALLEQQNYVPENPVSRIEGRIDWEPATSLFDLLTAFKDVLSAKREESVHEVDTEETHIEDRIAHVVNILRAKEVATFRDLFEDAPKKIVAVVTFIAILELVRAHRIAVFQARPFSELRVYRGELFDAAKQDVDLIDVTSIKAGMEV
jgi:segregation and condensation protein A